MKITLVLTGKTNTSFIAEGMKEYEKRIKFYSNFEIVVLPDIKNASNFSVSRYKQKEAEFQKKHITSDNFVVLLDEKGKQYSSKEFADFINKKQLEGIKNLVFIIGGAYGFSDEINEVVKTKLSLSKMTFPHQLIRLIFMEQLYRAFTIIRNEKYHH